MGRKEEEEEKVDFMRHQFPLKNGREQRARWSFALSLVPQSPNYGDGRGHGRRPLPRSSRPPSSLSPYRVQQVVIGAAETFGRVECEPRTCR